MKKQEQALKTVIDNQRAANEQQQKQLEENKIEITSITEQKEQLKVNNDNLKNRIEDSTS